VPTRRPGPWYRCCDLPHKAANVLIAASGRSMCRDRAASAARTCVSPRRAQQVSRRRHISVWLAERYLDFFAFLLPRSSGYLEHVTTQKLPLMRMRCKILRKIAEDSRCFLYYSENNIIIMLFVYISKRFRLLTLIASSC
jgi:hypothetical protein